MQNYIEYTDEDKERAKRQELERKGIKKGFQFVK
jgi:hypothetical protein